MSYFAELDENNLVIRVINAESLKWVKSALGGQWIKTFDDGSSRKQFASVGFTYDPVNDIFISPQPYPSWSLDSNYDWQAPVSMPDDNKFYLWDEEAGAWIDL
jgi:hypothetical protein